MIKLTDAELKQLRDALHFLHVQELKELCGRFALSESGKKKEIIFRLTAFLKSGKKIQSPLLPEISKAQKNGRYQLDPKTKILFGSYKNDAKKRKFMKQLIGEHFHFTAFGLDWIQNRWQAGNPPTYKEFADFWDEEFQRRKKSPATPKQEWAYLSFIQNYLKKNPEASRSEISKEWKQERSVQVKKVYEILGRFSFKKPCQNSG